jgi:hypothetical protein
MTRLAENSDLITTIVCTIIEVQNGSGYGSVEITLHNGRLTLIEKREKVRFTKNDKEPGKLITSSALNAQSTVATTK